VAPASHRACLARPAVACYGSDTTNGTICLAAADLLQIRAMTKAENRAAGRAWAAEKKRRFEEERDRAGREADLEAIRVLRDYLIFKAKTRGDAHERLGIAIDDYAEEITGDRTALHAKPASIGR
jgi:hypothetical protein